MFAYRQGKNKRRPQNTTAYVFSNAIKCIPTWLSNSIDVCVREYFGGMWKTDVKTWRYRRRIIYDMPDVIHVKATWMSTKPIPTGTFFQLFLKKKCNTRVYTKRTEKKTQQQQAFDPEGKCYHQDNVLLAKNLAGVIDFPFGCVGFSLFHFSVSIFFSWFFWCVCIYWGWSERPCDRMSQP